MAVWLCSLLRYKNKRTLNLFLPNQPRTSSLHIIVKFEVKNALFWDISLFYRINAFIVFVKKKIEVFNLFISICSLNCRLPLCCLLNSEVSVDNLLTCHAWHPESFLFVSSLSPPSSNFSFYTHTHDSGALCFCSVAMLVIIALNIFGW